MGESRKWPMHAAYLAELTRLELSGSVIFADDRAAYALACTVGLPLLLERGVHNVLRLGDRVRTDTLSLQGSQPPPDHAIVLCSTFLPETYSALRASLVHCGLCLNRCTIACTYSDRAHTDYLPGSRPAAAATSSATGAEPPPALLSAYAACAAEVARWPIARPAHRQPLDVRIVHTTMPLQLCPLGTTAFLLSSEGAQPLLESDLPEVHKACAARGADAGPPPATLSDVTWSSLPAARQRALGGCAMALVGWLRACALKPTLFALGPTSTLIARQVLLHLPTGPASAPADAPPAAADAAAAPTATPTDASVLIVDRSLDLVSPSLSTEHPLDALFAASSDEDLTAEVEARRDGLLPAEEEEEEDSWLEGLHLEPRTSLPLLSPPTAHVPSPGQPTAPSASPPKKPQPPPPPAPRPPLPLALAQAISSSEPACSSLLDAVLTRRGKEVGRQLLKVLASVADAYAPDDDDDDDALDTLPARPTGAALATLLERLNSNESIATERISELIAVSALLEASARADSDAPLGELIVQQKVLQHTAGESMGHAFTELITLATRAHLPPRPPPASGGGAPKPAAPVSLSVSAILPLVAMLYSLAGSAILAGADTEEHEQRLREALLQACLRDPACGGLLASPAPHVPIEELGGEAIMARRQKLSAALHVVFDRLRAVAASRKGLGASQALLLTSSQTTGDVYRPLLRHVLERALSGREDLPELTRLSASIGSLFSRGANLLGVKTRARLADHRTIVIFVLGGISVVEIRELRQLAAQHPKHRVLLGATQVATPAVIWELLTAGQHVR